MSLKWFQCPDKQEILVTDCLKENGCRMGNRCATRSYLKLLENEVDALISKEGKDE